MSAQEQTLAGHGDPGRQPGHGGGRRYGRLDEWELDADDIGEISGRGNARLRQLTPIRGLSGETLDPLIEDTLRDLRRELVEQLAKQNMTIDDVRRQLASHYLNETEKVTARLNRQALPRATRLLLSIDGLYECLLFSALKDGIGTAPAAGPPETHTHTRAAGAAGSATDAPGV